jgi:DTW domain-containing protein YfiP
VNRTAYEARKAARAAELARLGRPYCPRCRKALPTCYCVALRPFVAPVSFVILQHPAEARNPIATARMAHLSITNSELIAAPTFERHPRVESLLHDPGRRNVLLYPAPHAVALESVLDNARDDGGDAPTFWLLDAKWGHVPAMLRHSPTILTMPVARFAPPAGSRFQIRKQPRPHCLSTLETVHYVISLVRERLGDPSRTHDALLETFRYLVDQQLAYAASAVVSRHQASQLARAAKRTTPRPAGEGGRSVAR